MGRDPGGLIQRGVGVLFDAGALGDLGDGALLERFAAGRGDAAESAFAALVERHGPMVLRACRAVLRDEHEAHDAFQATFLVLAREARRLWVRDSVGPWLYGVAWRVASRARAAGARRRRHERRAAEMAARTDPGGPRDRRDDEEALHEEIRRLPDRFRAAVVLCDLEGMTTEQASARLGTPVGTVRSRLSRGRDRLRTRLIRRGLAPGLVAAGVTPSGAGIVPPALAEATVRAAFLYARAGAVPAGLAILIEGGRHAMTFKGLATLGIAAGLVAGAGVLAGQGPGRGKAVEAPKVVAKAAAKVEEAPGSNEADYHRFLTTWTVARVSIDGREDDNSEYMLGQFTFQTNTVVIHRIGLPQVQIDYNIAPDARPKAMRIADPHQQGGPVWWIYAMEGNKLRLAFDNGRPAIRPKGFDERLTNGHHLVVLELDRDPEAPPSLPPDPGPPVGQPADNTTPAKVEGPENDGQRLLGRWTILTNTCGGKEVADAELIFGTVEVRDQEIEVAAKGAKARYQYRIDPGSEPKAFRVVPIEPTKGEAFWGIYAFEKGKLKLAFATGPERPRGFDQSDSDDPLVVLELVRDDPPTPHAAKGPAASGDLAAADVQRLQGTWVAIAEERGGEEYPMQGDGRLVIAGNAIVSIAKDGPKGEEKVTAETFTIDSSREPRRIEVIREAPAAGSPKKVTGIYWVDGPTLLLAFDPTGAAVPTEFDTKPGSKQRTTVYRRRKPPRQVPATPAPAPSGLRR